MTLKYGLMSALHQVFYSQRKITWRAYELHIILGQSDRWLIDLFCS